jgi:hypothetical protein
MSYAQTRVAPRPPRLRPALGLAWRLGLVSRLVRVLTFVYF